MEITKDRIDYLNAKACLFHDSPLFAFGTNEDVKRIQDEQKEYDIKIEEINKRFKEALSKEYIR